MEFEESLIIKEDIEASYYKWEIFALERRLIEDETERRKIHNRMMYVLTGDHQYQKESQAIGARMTNQK
jgi:CII-binding regulator of phage lambda lysogenization HflD